MAKKKIKKQKAKKSALRFLVFGVTCLAVSFAITLTVSKLWSEIYLKYQEKQELEEKIVNLKEEEKDLEINVEKMQDEKSIIGIVKEAHREKCAEFKSFPPHCIIGSGEEDLIDELKQFENEEALIYLKNSTSVAHVPSFFEDILKMNNETKKLDKFIDEEATCANYINQEVQKLKQELDDSIENIIEKEKININYSFQPKELSKYIKSNVFGQDKAIDKIVQSIWSNYYF